MDETTSAPSTIPPAGTALPGPVELLRAAIARYREKFATIAGIAGVAFACALIEFAFRSAHLSVWAFIAMFVSAVVNYISYIALIIVIAHEGEYTAGIKAAYDRALHLAWKYLWTGILAGMAVMGGFLLLVIPGIYLAVMLLFVAYVVVLEEKGGFAALAQSFGYVRGSWWPVFGRFLFITLMMIIANAFVAFVGGIFDYDPRASHGMFEARDSIASFMTNLFDLFVFTPINLAFLFLLYKALKEKNAAADAADDQATHKRLKIFVVIGVVGAAIVIALLLFAVRHPFS